MQERAAGVVLVPGRLGRRAVHKAGVHAATRHRRERHARRHVPHRARRRGGRTVGGRVAPHACDRAPRRHGPRRGDGAPVRPPSPRAARSAARRARQQQASVRRAGGCNLHVRQRASGTLRFALPTLLPNLLGASDGGESDATGAQNQAVRHAVTVAVPRGARRAFYVSVFASPAVTRVRRRTRCRVPCWSSSVAGVVLTLLVRGGAGAVRSGSQGPRRHRRGHAPLPLRLLARPRRRQRLRAARDRGRRRRRPRRGAALAVRVQQQHHRPLVRRRVGPRRQVAGVAPRRGAGGRAAVLRAGEDGSSGALPDVRTRERGAASAPPLRVARGSLRIVRVCAGHLLLAGRARALAPRAAPSGRHVPAHAILALTRGARARRSRRASRARVTRCCWAPRRSCSPPSRRTSCCSRVLPSPACMCARCACRSRAPRRR